ncbi:MAG: LysR family transcriptional regulator [Myxococcota bacterium]
MSLDQLRGFVTIADEGSVRRAAARLHISQPPLSRQLHALEDELGCALFVRTPRGMVLREEGRRLLPRARAILALVESCRPLVAGDGAGRAWTTLTEGSGKGFEA